MASAPRRPLPARHPGPAIPTLPAEPAFAVEAAVVPPGSHPGSHPGDPGLGASLFLRDQPAWPPAERARPCTGEGTHTAVRGVSTIRRLARWLWRARRHPGAPPPATPARTLLTDAVFLAIAGLLAADAVAGGAGSPRAIEIAAFAAFTSLAALTGLVGTGSWAGSPRGDDPDSGARGGYPAMTTTWTLPIALLLPPLYALLACLPLWLAALPGRERVARPAQPEHPPGGPGGCGAHSQIHDCVALGLAGAAAAAVHHLLAPASDPGSADGLAASARDLLALLAAVAAYPAVDRLLRPRRWPGGREHAATVTVEICAALVLTVVWAASPVLLVIAAPLVLLLRRGLTHAELLTAARTDAKTQLATMAYWRQVALRETARTRGLGRPLSVLLVDIDHFKQVNDRHGHLNGDAVLVAVANMLRHATRPQDLVGRFGGEEFVVLLADADLDAAATVAERIRHTVAGARIHLSGVEVSVTVSVGVASIAPAPRENTARALATVTAEAPRAADDDLAVVTDLLERADAALYRAKREGRDRVCTARTTSPPAPADPSAAAPPGSTSPGGAPACPAASPTAPAWRPPAPGPPPAP
ncbi:sensor domain-containing diguanylate cyclase [Parafrankia sp. FMc2]|uniref:sensor domain-containing diguanylate cyclase n=1 Tax=Parafrankia sp. FMc2 TaxID=3233196 RepID=UPI0034D45469